MFHGDNIYGDTIEMVVLQKKCAELEAVEGFRRLRDATTQLATWDDHDYGLNDGGKSCTKRVEIPTDLFGLFQWSTGLTAAEAGGSLCILELRPSGKSCQILLFDTRYFRDELLREIAKPTKDSIGWYAPTRDTSKTLLGETHKVRR